MDEEPAYRGKANGNSQPNIIKNLDQQSKCGKYGENKQEVDDESYAMESDVRDASVRLALEKEMRQLRRENYCLRKDLERFKDLEERMEKMQETLSLLRQEVNNNLWFSIRPSFGNKLHSDKTRSTFKGRQPQATLRGKESDKVECNVNEN